MLGGLGIPELIIVLVIIMIVFGVGKLPQIGGGLGEAIRNFKKAQSEPDAIDVTSEGSDGADDQAGSGGSSSSDSGPTKSA